MLRPLVHTPIGLVGGVSVLLLQLADEAVLLAPDFLKLVVGQLAPLFPRVAFELFPLALDDVPVHLRLPLSTDSDSTVGVSHSRYPADATRPKAPARGGVRARASAARRARAPVRPCAENHAQQHAEDGGDEHQQDERD